MYTDPLDHAAHLQEVHNEESLKKVRAGAAPEQVPLPDGTWKHVDCVDCGEPIGDFRLTLGRVRCIDCQTAKEGRRR